MRRGKFGADVSKVGQGKFFGVGRFGDGEVAEVVVEDVAVAISVPESAS